MMAEQSAFLLSLMALSLAAGIASRLAGEEKSGRYVRFASALCVLVMLAGQMETVLVTIPQMLHAVSQGAKGGTVSPQLPTDLYDELTAASAEAITSQLEGEIRRRYGAETDIHLTLDTSDYQSIEILGAVVTVSRSDAIYQELIGRLLADTLGCRVEWEILD